MFAPECAVSLVTKIENLMAVPPSRCRKLNGRRGGAMARRWISNVQAMGRRVFSRAQFYGRPLLDCHAGGGGGEG